MPIFNLALAGITGLVISTEARDAILRTRPELAGDFETFGDRSFILFTSLLRPALNSPCSQFSPSLTQLSTQAPLNLPPRGLGDFVAVLLHRLGIRAAITLLQRRGLLRGCQCAARQARLNALTPRLRGLLEPWPMTLAVLLSWLLFVVALLAR